MRSYHIGKRETKRVLAMPFALWLSSIKRPAAFKFFGTTKPSHFTFFKVIRLQQRWNKRMGWLTLFIFLLVFPFHRPHFCFQFLLANRAPMAAPTIRYCIDSFSCFLLYFFCNYDYALLRTSTALTAWRNLRACKFTMTLILNRWFTIWSLMRKRNCRKYDAITRSWGVVYYNGKTSLLPFDKWIAERD